MTATAAESVRIGSSGPADPLPHHVLVRATVLWVAVGVVVVNWPLAALRAAQHPQGYRYWAAPIVLAALAVELTWAVVHGIRGGEVAGPLRVVVATCYLALAVHPWILTPAAPPYPPLLHVLGAGMCISAVYGVRASLVMIPAFAAGVAALRWPHLGPIRAVGEAGLLALSGMVATAIVDVLHGAGRTVFEAVRTTWRLREDLVRGSRRRDERERWDGLVHDTVLGALRIASRAEAPVRAVPDAARDLARQAAVILRGGSPAGAARSAGPPRRAWREAARRLGLDVEIEVREDGPVADEEVRDAVTDAVREVLTNVARHSGQRHARIAGSVGARHAEITVTDPGRGFAAEAAAFGEGLGTSVVARMRSVGGSALVLSRPGHGTSVRVTWRARSIPEPVPDSIVGPSSARWRQRTYTPLAAIGTLVVVFDVLLGLDQIRLARWPALAVPGIVVVAVLLVVVSRATPSWWVWSAVTAASVLTVGGLTANTAATAEFAWRYWYLGALTVVVGAVAFRFPPGAGLLTAGAVTATVVALDAVSRRPPWDCLLGPVPVLAAVAGTGQLLRRALDRAWQLVTEATADEARLQLDLAIQQDRTREAEARVEALADTVGPALDLILSAPTITADQARELALLEASARDHLAASALLDADVVRAVYASRRRGIRVDVLALGEGGADPGQDGFRRMLVTLLDAAEPPDRVRVVWHGGADGASGTLVVVGPHAARLRDRLALTALRLPAPGPRVSGDDASVLVDFGADLAAEAIRPRRG
jgi:hypothetical protein